MRHNALAVLICEMDPHLYSLWHWLINVATESLIREIPLGVPVGTDIKGLGLSLGQQLLLKTWQRTNNVGKCWTISPWGNMPGQWTANTRARVASEFHAVKHWRLYGNGMAVLRAFGISATWFLDPPYQYNYNYGQPPLDYGELGALVQAKSGQKIVCEALCQKTGATPNWLPFFSFGERITSRRKVGNNHHSKELLWIGDSI